MGKKMEEITVRTSRREEFLDITHTISQTVKNNNWNDGILTVFIPHTTAGITINEHADPDVVNDIISELGKLVPQSRHYKHTEGNADAHIKSSLIGSSVSIIIENSSLKLGTWQGVFFCEFDGPRTRHIWLKFCKS